MSHASSSQTRAGSYIRRKHQQRNKVYLTVLALLAVAMLLYLIQYV